jgi:PAS domain-containing protein
MLRDGQQLFRFLAEPLMNRPIKQHAPAVFSGTEAAARLGSASNGDAYLVVASSDDVAQGAQRRDPSPGSAASPTSPALRRAADVLGSVVGAMALVAIVLDGEARVVYANDRLRALVRIDGDAVGEPWLDRFVDQPCDDIKAAFQRLLAGDQTVETYTLDVLKRGGGHARIFWHNALVRDGERVVGSASIGEILMEDVEAERPAGRDPAGDPAAVVATARAAVDTPETATIPLVKMIAEHCAQLAEERPQGAAAYIRSEFRIDA